MGKIILNSVVHVCQTITQRAHTSQGTRIKFNRNKNKYLPPLIKINHRRNLFFISSRTNLRSKFLVENVYDFTLTWSNPLSNMERTIQLVSKPNLTRNPAHSRATYEAPTTSVFPGGEGREKTSSLVIPYSFAPGISGYLGRPPTCTQGNRVISV